MYHKKIPKAKGRRFNRRSSASLLLASGHEACDKSLEHVEIDQGSLGLVP